MEKRTRPKQMKFRVTEKEKEMIDRRTSLISKGRKPMKEAGWMMRTRNIRIMERQKPMIQKKWQAL